MTHEETKTFKILRNWEKIRKDLHKPFTEAPLLEAEIHFSIQQAIAEDRARVNVIIQNILLAVESSAHKNEKGEDVVYAGQVNRLMGEVDDILSSQDKLTDKE